MLPANQYLPGLNHRSPNGECRLRRASVHGEMERNFDESRKPVLVGYLGGGFKYFLFATLFGEDSHFD